LKHLSHVSKKLMILCSYQKKPFSLADSNRVLIKTNLLNVKSSRLCEPLLRSRSIFVRLRLQLVKNFGSGSSSDLFHRIFSRKKFSAFNKISNFLKTKLLTKWSFKLIPVCIYIKINFNLHVAKIDFTVTTCSRSRPKNFGFGSRKMLRLHGLRLRNTGVNILRILNIRVQKLLSFLK
jgi:hypothetical protein